MKYLKSFSINERKQVGDLYHFTTTQNLLSIIETNMLKANPKYDNAVSFTRDKHIYLRDPLIVGTDIRLMVDGDKLSDRHKIEPFAYYKYGWKGQPETFVQRRIESEERAMGDIVNISSYLLAIDLNTNSLKTAIPEFLDELKAYCKRRGIEVGFYKAPIEY